MQRIKNYHLETIINSRIRILYFKYKTMKRFRGWKFGKNTKSRIDTSHCRFDNHFILPVGWGVQGWNWNSLSMIGVLFWLIIGIILLIVGLVCVVVSTLRKKSKKKRDCPYCSIFMDYLETDSIYQCPKCKRKFRDKVRA